MGLRINDALKWSNLKLTYFLLNILIRHFYFVVHSKIGGKNIVIYDRHSSEMLEE